MICQCKCWRVIFFCYFFLLFLIFLSIFYFLLPFSAAFRKILTKKTNIFTITGRISSATKKMDSKIAVLFSNGKSELETRNVAAITLDEKAMVSRKLRAANLPENAEFCGFIIELRMFSEFREVWKDGGWREKPFF